MAGGIVERDPVKLADTCAQFKRGVEKYYDSEPNKGDMWFFELYHHLGDCEVALRKLAALKVPA